MKRNIKYRLMTGILAGTLFITGWHPNIIKASAATIGKETTITNDYTENTQTTTLEDFLNEIEDKQLKKFYKQLYELYDYDTFHERSVIPQYFQTIYGNKFSCGTIQSAGCGISSLAMVSSYLFDEVITPDMMTIYDSGPSPAAALEKGIKRLKLNCEIHRGQVAIDNLDKAIEEGHPIIALVGGSSIFTDKGHFIVIAGKTQDGKYIVNDPNLENFFNPNMVEGFTNGFTFEEVTKGLRGIYIFDTKKDFIDKRDKDLSLKTNKKNFKAENNYNGILSSPTEMRIGPSENYPIISNLEINSEIARIYSTTNGWDLVKSNQSIGYIKTKNITYSKEIEESLSEYMKYNDIVFSTSPIEVKETPNEDSQPLSTIDINTELKVIAKIGDDWLIINHNGLIGYIQNKNIISMLKKAQELYPELQLEELTTKKISYLTTDTDIRCGNSIEFDSLELIHKYESLKVLEEYENWYFALTNNGTLGFIPKKYTKDINDECIIVDKSQGLLYFLKDGEQIYSTNANINTALYTSKNGIYEILSKKLNLFFINKNIGWQNIFDKNTSNLNNFSFKFASKVYNEVELGTQIIIHK